MVLSSVEFGVNVTVKNTLLLSMLFYCFMLIWF